MITHFFGKFKLMRHWKTIQYKNGTLPKSLCTFLSILLDSLTEISNTSLWLNYTCDELL